MYAVYHDAIRVFDAAMQGPKTNGHTLASFSIFGTFPAPYFGGSDWGPLLDQIVGTAFLVMFVMALVDLRNTAPKANMGPLLIGLAVAAIGISYGANAGYAINPVRDFGPRLFGALVGTTGLFTGLYWLLAPIIGPLIGGPLGVILYDIFIKPGLDAEPA